MRRCPVPVHLMTGNHDDPEALLAEFGGTPYLGGGGSLSYAIEYPEATIIAADSRLDASPAGYAEPPGYLAEPIGFLLHLLDGAGCVTHSVAASHASAVLAF
jgi:hypothetical protein